MLLVDLPGYGFAKAPPEAIKNGRQAIDGYLNERPTLRLILLLIDSAEKLVNEDHLLIEWAAHKKIPLLVILTKTDKLSALEIEAQMKKHPARDSLLDYKLIIRHFLSKRIGTTSMGLITSRYFRLP